MLSTWEQQHLFQSYIAPKHWHINTNKLLLYWQQVHLETGLGRSDIYRQVFKDRSVFLFVSHISYFPVYATIMDFLYVGYIQRKSLLSSVIYIRGCEQGTSDFKWIMAADSILSLTSLKQKAVYTNMVNGYLLFASLSWADKNNLRLRTFNTLMLFLQR